MNEAPIYDLRPLLAFLAPLVGLIGIALAGEKRANLRELFTFLAAITQASLVLSMLPLVLGGAVIRVSGLANFYKCSSAFPRRWTGSSFCMRGFNSMDCHHFVLSWIHAWSA